MVYGESTGWEPPIGIREQEQSAAIIYPNPNNGTFEIKIDHASETYAGIQIYDMAGKLLYQQNITEDISKVNISSYPNGIYFVKMVGKDRQNSIIKKVIIAK